MLEYLKKQVSELEGQVASGALISRDDCLQQLRHIGLANFGDFLFSLPQPDVPHLSRVLPAMASPDTQMKWTGAHGRQLLQQSLDFVLLASAYYTSCTGKALRNASILDFGCGYGRLLRLFLYYTSEANLYGVDPLQASLNECISCGLTSNLYLSEFLPREMPFPHRTFDFIYSFSVFTHLNEQAAIQCLNTLYYYLDPRGLLVITIRPAEFWQTPSHVEGYLQAHSIDTADLVERHRRGEYVFVGSGGVGHETYGDSSFDLGWLTSRLSQFRVVFVDQSLADSMQLYVGLMKN